MNFIPDFLSRRSFLSVHPSVSIPTDLDAFQLHPFNSTRRAATPFDSTTSDAFEYYLPPFSTSQPWGLKLKSKTEEYQGEQKRRLTVLTCAPVDYAAEAKHLLSLIQGTA